MRTMTNATGLAALLCFLAPASSWAQARAASEPTVQVFAGCAYLHAEPLAHQFSGSDDHGWNTFTKLGGGLDLAVAPHLAVRVVEADYLKTEVFNQSQNSFGLSFGILLGFGKHQATAPQENR